MRSELNLQSQKKKINGHSAEERCEMRVRRIRRGVVQRMGGSICESFL